MKGVKNVHSPRWSSYKIICLQVVSIPKWGIAWGFRLHHSELYQMCITLYWYTLCMYTHVTTCAQCILHTVYSVHYIQCTVHIIHSVLCIFTQFRVQCVWYQMCLIYSSESHCTVSSWPLRVPQPQPGSHSRPFPRWKSYFATSLSLNILNFCHVGRSWLNANTKIWQQQILNCSMAE